MLKSRWGVLAAYVLVTSANQMLWLTFAPITSDAAAHYGVSVGSIGLLSEVFPLLYVLLAIPAGFALDRLFRGSLLLGAWLTAFGGLLRLLGDTFAMQLTGQVVIAIAQPLVASALIKVASVWTRDEDRPLGIALGSAGLSLGLLLALGSGGALGIGHLAALLQGQAVYAVVGAVLLTLATRVPGRVIAAPTATGRAALRAVWAEPVVRVTTALVIVGFGVFVALTTYLEPLLKPAGVTSGQASGLLVTMVVAGIVGSLVLPPIVARRAAERTTLVTALVVSAIGTASLAALHVLAGVALVLAIMGFFLLATLPVVFELVERRAGAQGATAASLLWMAGNAGGLVLALVIGLLVAHPALAFVVMAVVPLLGLPVLARLRLTESPVQEPPVQETQPVDAR